MRAINHALTGAAIGLVIGEPLVAVPVAVLSHFVCDAIPHYDGLQARPSKQAVRRWLNSSLFRRLLYVDAVLCFLVVTVLAIRQPLYWQLGAVCAFAAASPDLLSLKIYQDRHAKHLAPFKGYYKFAHAIQWFQRPIGAVVEVAWFGMCLVVLTPFLR